MLYILELPDMLLSTRLVVLIACLSANRVIEPSLLGLGSGLSFASFVLILLGLENSFIFDDFSAFAGFSAPRDPAEEYSAGGKLGDAVGLR
jgi:hypothetical protein